jgi:hypothetical protein
MGFDAGDSNLYRYAKNAPTDATDPSGLQPADPLQPIQKLAKSNEAIVAAIKKKNGPNDPRLLFLNTQQEILNQLANNAHFRKDAKAAEWLNRVLNVFMGSLNNALDGKIAPPFNGKRCQDPFRYRAFRQSCANRRLQL